MDVSGIVLAAGASRRMGTSKALLDFHGETFVARLRRILGQYCREVIVVGPPDQTFDADVVNPDPERGMLSSLQCGLARVSPDADAVLWTLVDLPAVQPETIGRIADARDGDRVRIARYQGKRGHPVWASRALIPEIAGATGTPKDVILRYEQDIVYVDVDDPGVVLDADTPEDYLRLKSATRRT